MQAEKQKLVRVWESTGLHRAWERAVQGEAITKATDLFKGAEPLEIDHASGCEASLILTPASKT